MNIMVITGASRGLGKEIRDYYYDMHAGRTEVFGVSSSECDVSDADAVAKYFSQFKQVNYLINCAGIAAMNHTLLQPAKQAQRVMDVNFQGTLNCSREAAKKMVKNKFGRIINFSTIAVPRALEGEAVYASSKAAVEKLTQVMAKELGAFNITVNSIGPCPIETDLIRNVPKQKIDALIQGQAIKRMGTPQDVIDVVDFFLNNEMVTGQTIYLGG